MISVTTHAFLLLMGLQHKVLLCPMHHQARSIANDLATNYLGRINGPYLDI